MSWRKSGQPPGGVGKRLSTGKYNSISRRCCLHHRVTKDLIAWEAAGTAPEDATFRLLHSKAAGLSIDSDSGAVGGADGAVELTWEPGGLPQTAKRKFPHLAHLPLLRLPEGATEAASDLLRQQLAVSASSDGELLKTTGERRAHRLQEAGQSWMLGTAQCPRHVSADAPSQTNSAAGARHPRSLMPHWQA